MNIPEAWHPDPTGSHEYRWWDGARWTEHVADNGRASVDPLPPTPPTDAQTAAGDTQAAAGGAHGAAGGAPEAAGGAPEAAGGAPERTEQTPAAEPDRWRSSPGSDATGAASGADWQMPGAQGTSARSPTQASGPAWSSGGTGAAAPATQSNGMAIAAAVIGVISLLISFVPLVGLVGGLGGVLALILGFVAKKRATEHGVGRGAAITGIVTGILALLISVVFTAGFVIIGGDVVSTYADCIDAGGSDAECQESLNRELTDQFDQFGQ